MKNSKFGYIVVPVVFLCLFIAPHIVNASCPISGVDQSVIDSCLKQQALLDQQARNQQAANTANAQALYQSQLTYFYQLDASEKKLDAINASDFGYVQYQARSSDCTQSIRIPSDPTTLDPNAFLSLMANKVACVNYLLQYSLNKAASTQTVAPTKTNDQVCQDKYGTNSNWNGTKGSNGGLICACASGYQWNGSNTSCVQTPTCTSGFVLVNGSCVSGALGCLNSWGANSVWTGTACSCASGYQWDSSKSQCTVLNVPATVTTPTKTSSSHNSGLATNQIAAILSLLQAFGADQSVIASVQAALGQ